MPDPGVIYVSAARFGEGYDLFVVQEGSYLVFGHDLLGAPVHNEFQDHWNTRDDVLGGLTLAVDDRIPDVLG